MLLTLLFFIQSTILKFVLLFVKANLFANNFEKFYSEESIVNQEPEHFSVSGFIFSVD